MPALRYADIFVLVVMANCEYVRSFSTNPSVENGGTAVVVAPENAANVTVFCEVTFGDGGSVRVSRWFLTPKNGARERVRFDSEPNFDTSGFQSNFTILSFGADLGMATLECTNNLIPPDNQTVYFILRTIDLRRASTPVIAVEHNLFTFNISTSDSPVSSYQWFYNGDAINTTTSTNPNVSVYLNIVFSSVVRTQSGNYSMTANTFGGDITGYFILSVHYPVAADVSGTQMYYGVEGGSVTLVAHVNITGNPVPGSVWMFNGATARGDAVVSGQLTITNLTPADSGNYTNTLNNTLNDGSTSSISNTVGLRIFALPSEPTSLNVTDIGSDYADIHWTNPSSSDATFTKFIVELTGPSSVTTHDVTGGSNTNLSATNTFRMDRLQPNTSYSVRVRGVSTHPTLGDILGTWSSNVSFMTMLGEPEFEFALLENVGGKLNVTYSFKHTGGVPLTGVAVVCSSVEEGSGDGLTHNMDCSTSCEDGGMVLIPTGSEYVTAGMNYSCTVTATNKFSNQQGTQRNTDHVLATLGIPSEPRITGVTPGVNMFILTVQLYAGHTSSLYFNVSVISMQGFMLVPNLQPQNSVSTNLMNYTITVPFNQPGQNRFMVTARNLFGDTMESAMFPPMGLDGVEVLPPPTTPDTTTTGPVSSATPVTTGTTQPPSDAASVNVGVIAGVVVLVVAIVLIILIVLLVAGFLIYRNKGQPNKSIPAADNEAYGVLRGRGRGGGVYQSIELKDNAAYSTVLVNVQPAHNQSITMDTNADYEVISVKPDYVYEIPNI